MSLTIPVRYLVQNFLHKSILEKTYMVDLWNRIQDHHSIENRINIYDIIKDINSKLVSQKLMIQETICNFTGQIYFVLVSTSKNEIISFNVSKKEMEVFRSVLTDILRNKCLKINFNEVNETNHDLLMKFTEEHYFVKQDNALYLGVRSISQFSSVIKNSPVFKKLRNCIACTTLVIYGAKCHSCNFPMHHYCKEKYFETETQCPKCHEVWINY